MVALAPAGQCRQSPARSDYPAPVTKFPLAVRAGVMMPLPEFDVAWPQRIITPASVLSR